MEAPAVIAASAHRVQSYSDTEWYAKRSVIGRLYLGERKTVGEIVTFLARQHNFYVK